MQTFSTRQQSRYQNNHFQIASRAQKKFIILWTLSACMSEQNVFWQSIHYSTCFKLICQVGVFVNLFPKYKISTLPRNRKHVLKDFDIIISRTLCLSCPKTRIRYMFKMKKLKTGYFYCCKFIIKITANVMFCFILYLLQIWHTAKIPFVLKYICIYTWLYDL